MSAVFQLGSKVQFVHYNGWASPGCVISYAGGMLRIYWPDDDQFTNESPEDLAPYGMDNMVELDEIAA